MTETVQSRLQPDAGSGIYRLSSRAGAAAVERLARAAGWQFLCVDANAAEDKRAFLSAAARGLRFPEWAGHNWDAFEELVNDLSWLPPAPGCLVLIDGLGKFGRRQPGAMQTAVEILQGAAVNRARSQTAPLVVLLRGAGAAASHLQPLAIGKLPGAYGKPTEQQDA